MQQTKPYILERKRSQAEREALEAKRKLNNQRFGMLIFQIGWMMAFIALVVVNWQLRFQYESWPPPGVQALGITLPTLATLALLVSLLFARWTRRRVSQDKMTRFLSLWGAVIAFGGVFVTIMVYEWFRVDTGTQYSAVFRLMTTFHSLHALAVGVYMVNIYMTARRVQAGTADESVMRYGSENIWPIDAATRMWEFVFLAWLLFYVVLYWWRSA